MHGGDFTLKSIDFALSIIEKLNGKHIFIKGSHDAWLNKFSDFYVSNKISKALLNKIEDFGNYMWERKIQSNYITVCHYAGRVWPRSHHGSIQLYGHSHGQLMPLKNQYDIGVDNNRFFPVSLNEIKKLLNINDDRNLYNL